MSARLLHGVLLGTLVVLVAAFLELRALFSDWPYHRNWGLAWEWWLAHAASGALLGAGAALALPILDRKRIRAGQPGLSLLAPILGGMVAFVAFFGGHFSGLGGAPLQLLGALVGGAFVSFALLGFARGPIGWTLSGFVTPWFCCVGLVILTSWAAVLGAQGPQPAREVQVGSPPPAEQRGPNVLLIVLDTLSARHLGAYGYHRPTSPALDALADEGVVFDRAYSTAPWTLPSHASLFTGLHPTSHRTGWTHPRLDDGRAIGSKRIRYDFLTLSEELNARGYHTCGVSEKSWLTQEHGLTQGFQEYYDYSIQTASERLLLPRALDRLAGRLGRPSPLRSEPVDQGGARVVETALHWLREDHDEDRPFLLFLNLNEAHAPYTPPKGFDDFGRFLPPGAVLEDLPDGYFGHAADRRNYNSGARELLDAEAEIQRALYDASILYQDGLLAQLFEGLREQELMEDTLVIVTSDHGEEFNEQGRFGHQMSLSDRLLHVPLIVRYPELIPARARVADPVSLVDVFPTILGVIEAKSGFAPPRGPALQALEGFDLLPRMRGEAAAPRDWVLAHADNPTGYLVGFTNFALDGSFPLAETSMHAITMLRRGSQKYFRFSDGVEAWLDLGIDPNEDAAERGQPSESSSLPAEAEAFAQGLDLLLERLSIRREMLAGHVARFALAKNRDAVDDERRNQELLGYIGEQAAPGEIPPPPLPAQVIPD